AMATLHQAEANVKIKQGALDKAKADLDHCTITSPIDGVVISRSVDVGQTVAASLQAPVIFQIANDLTKLQIDSNVAEGDVGAVRVNARPAHANENPSARFTCCPSGGRSRFKSKPESATGL